MQTDKSFDKLKNLPWKALAWVVGSSFVCATALSMSAAWLFFPETKEARWQDGEQFQTARIRSESQQRRHEHYPAAQHLPS